MAHHCHRQSDGSVPIAEMAGRVIGEVKTVADHVC